MRISLLAVGCMALGLAACGGGSSGTTPAPVTPTATLAASPVSVLSGSAAMLTWTSTNARGCTASGGWTGALATSGSKSTGALSKSTTYSITCLGAGGTSKAVAATVAVEPLPTVSLKAYPTVVPSGQASVLTWSSTGATSCTASGAWSGSVGTSGTRNTDPLSADASYSIVCTGSSGTSTTVSAAVVVSDTVMSVTPATAAITLTRTQQFSATVPGGGAANWTVDGVSGGNPTVGTISSAGLYTAGASAGGHTVVATSVANDTQSANAVAAVTDLGGMYTYHNDLARDGANNQEYALTTSNVTAAHFGKLTSCKVDGVIAAQPLWVANVTIAAAKHNVVFVATQHDGLFAFDADAVPCVKLWSMSLIDASHGATSGETPVSWTLVGNGYGDIQPEIGVTGTPVIDPALKILYVVSKSVDSGQTTFYQRLHAIDITTGSEKTGSPLTISGSFPGTGDGGSTVSFNPKQELQRTGLAFANGSVYLAWAAHEDKAPWYGWMMAYHYTGSGFTQTGVINVAPNAQEAGIWMSGGAPAVDASGKVYVITGNGPFNATSTTAPNNDYGDTLLQLTPTLSVSQWFTPSDEMADDQNDADFGSGGAAILADLPAGNTVTHALICGGKDHSLYVIDRDLLGGFGDTAAVQQTDFGHGIFATAALWNNNLYLAGLGGPLQAYQLNTSTAQFSPGTSSSHLFGFPGATPSVSAAATHNGIVWSLDTNKYCTASSHACGPAVLYAHDAGNVGTELWNSAANSADAAGLAVKFSVPTVANGHVYVGTRGNNIGGTASSTSIPGELDIYGLKP